MAIPLPFDIRYDERVKEGTAVYDSTWRMPYEFNGVLLFHSREDHQRWLDGEAFRLIIKGNPPPPPRYDIAEKKRKLKR